MLLRQRNQCFIDRNKLTAAVVRAAIYGMLNYGKVEKHYEVKDCFHVMEIFCISRAISQFTKFSLCPDFCGTLLK
jgi:hypothetical protein